MKPIEREPRFCPLCGKTYTEHPALQALASIGIDAEEQEKILEAIHGAS